MSDFKFKLNSKGVRDMLRSQEVQAMLRERAEAIKGKSIRSLDVIYSFFASEAFFFINIPHFSSALK